MRVSDYICDEIIKAGTRFVFGYQGANITYVVDAISTQSRLRYVQTYHEQGAAFAANGYAQASGCLGVAVASSGPGALNLITGVANAYFDSIPTLFISGDLSRRVEKSGLPLRQDGFQGTDIISIVRPITKYAEMIRTPGDVSYCLTQAIYQATHGRRGPVYITIPHWIQRAEIEPASLQRFIPEIAENVTIQDALLGKIMNAIRKARRPMLLLGGGCSDQKTKDELNKYLKRNPLPVVASLCALDVLPHDHPSYIGFIGDYGHRHANMAFSASDCLIVLGSRMDERQIGIHKDYPADKTIIHVDIDPAELLPYSERYFPINESAACFIRRMHSMSFDLDHCAAWRKKLAELQIKYPVLPASKTLTVSNFLRKLSELLLPTVQIYVDVGLHQMVAAQAIFLSDNMRMMFSGGLGSMGYALPACVGGYFAAPERQTICLTGDGGLMMNLQELQTITRENLDVKIVVINNYCLGMVRDYQVKALDGRDYGTVEGYQPCDMEKMASAFDLRFLRISTSDGMDLLSEVINYVGPVLVEVAFTIEMAPFPAGFDYSLQDELLSGWSEK